MRRYSVRLLVSLASLSLLCAGSALAWPTDPTHNVVVARGPGVQYSFEMATDGAGGALVAWTDSSSVTGQNIRVSRLRANGTLDPAWPVGGAAVCSATGEQQFPWLVSDGAGGALVIWSDRRSGTNSDVYAHHVLASGALDAGWPGDGAVVCSSPGDQTANSRSVATDGAGGAIVAWNDFRNGQWDVYAHHVTTTGVDAAWGAQGRPVCTATGTQFVTALVSDESGGGIVAWFDERSGTANADVYAMRLLADGSLAAGWTVDGVQVTSAALRQVAPAGVPDGQHGAILVWTDGRSGNSDLYCHRVLASGALSGAFAADGTALCVQPERQSSAQVVSDGAGGGIVGWYDRRDGVNTAVYAHHVKPTGVDAGWPANGLAVRIETGEWYDGQIVSRRGLAPDGAGGAIATWQDFRNGQWDVYAMRVLAAGSLDPAWPVGGRAVSTAAADQGGPTAFAGTGGRSIILWGDYRNAEGLDVYGQGLTPGGELGVATLASGVGFPSLQRGSIDWGDYDADGDLDLLMTGTDLASPRCYLFRNDGGTFTSIDAGLPGVEWSSAEWGDYDCDGDLDIALAGWNGTPGIARIYRNDGIYGFTDIGVNLPGVTYASVAWGDFDYDGDLDLLLAGLDNANVRIARIYRFSNGSFSEVAVGLTGVASGDADWGDFDADGDLDLLLSGSALSGRLTRVYMNLANDVLYPLDLGLPGVEGMDGSLAWGDYDNDGDLDILLSGWDGATRHLAIFRNDGGVFSDVDANLAGLSSGAVAWGDYDNDGDLDVIASGYGDQGGGLSRIYRNDGGTFLDAHAGLPDLFFSAVAWADWDGDGDLDPAISGAPDFGSATTALLRTDGATPNTPPTAPTNLWADRNGSYVTFHWTESTDAQTPPGGLSYNIRVGVAGGPDFPVTSMSRADGFRKVVRMGNAGQGPSFGLHVNPQELVWSVQAVDGAFAGSPFSLEKPIVGVAGGPVSMVEGLHAPSPNPFRAGTRLAWSLAQSGPVELALYDPSGRRVRVLERGVRSAGPGGVTWDGRDDNGRQLPPGLYFVRLEAGAARWGGKVVLAR